MMTPIHSMQALFEQLGLDSQPADITQFIQEHSIRDSMKTPRSRVLDTLPSPVSQGKFDR